MKVDGDWAEAKVVGGAAGGNFAIIMTDEGKRESDPPHPEMFAHKARSLRMWLD